MAPAHLGGDLSLVCGMLDIPRLRLRAEHYARKGGASAATVAQLGHLLQADPIGQGVLALSGEQLQSMLVTDLYKIKVCVCVCV